MKQTNAMKNLVGSIISDKEVSSKKTEATETAPAKKESVNTDNKQKSRQKTTDRLEASGERVIKTTYSIRQSTHKKIRLIATLTGQNLPELIDEALNQYIESKANSNPELKAVLDIK